MAHRIPYSEKGKGLAQSSQAPRISRVRVPHFDNSALIQKHSLTLIGRITNPQQRIWSLIPFLSDHWKTTSRAIGADLGQGLFQFQFAYEEDLQLVLDNRPYHFAKWMIILQRWEPTVDKSFPSQIPFWIWVQGIPTHLWSEETFKSLGEDIGHFEKLEITNSSAKIRVHVNGLQPLITTSTVEFYNGDEVTATLVYEKLEKHCTKCFRLNHEKKDCTLFNKDDPIRRLDSQIQSKIVSLSNSQNSADRIQHPRESSHRYSPRKSFYPTPSGHIGHDNRSGSLSTHLRYLPRERHIPRDYNQYSKDRSSQSGYQREPRRYHTPVNSHSSGRFEENLPTRYGAQAVWKEKNKDQEPARTSPFNRKEVSDSSRSRWPPLERTLSPDRAQPELPRQAIDEALGELREVMVQYTSCADPSESAARKERVRQAEAAGQLEETATQMVRSSLEKHNRIEEAEKNLDFERIPASLRIGPLNEASTEDLTGFLMEEEFLPPSDLDL